MPVRKGKCINFGLCPKADSREIITVNDGEEFSCPFPDCRKPLQALTTPPPPPPPPWLVIGGIVGLLAIIVTALLWHPWARPESSVKRNLPIKQPAVDNAVDNAIDPCQHKNWSQADADDVLSSDCKGKGNAAYDERLKYIESLREIRNWASVKPDDSRLNDCAGIHACEERSQHHPTPPHTIPERETSGGRDWSKASCEEVKEAWQGEDPRLSTPTCGGLNKSSCSHIQRCLGLHPLNVGPGNSPD